MAWHGMAWHGMAWHGMAWHAVCAMASRAPTSPGRPPSWHGHALPSPQAATLALYATTLRRRPHILPGAAAEDAAGYWRALELVRAGDNFPDEFDDRSELRRL
jgi:hypothetical protein